MWLAGSRNNRFDTLRLLAALMVLWSHAFPLAGLGHLEPLARLTGLDTLGGLGVAIFFVLSGYLLTLSWERKSRLMAFAWNRVLRIYPALLVLCVLCIGVLGPALTTLDASVYWVHPQTRGYGITATAWDVAYPLPGVFATNPLPHAVNGSLWSLPYELRCYVVLVLVALLPVSMRVKSLLVLVVLGVLFGLRPAGAEVFVRYYGVDYYHLKLGWFFACGCALAAWRQRLTGMRRLWIVMVLLPVLIGLMLLMKGALLWLTLWTMVSVVVIWLANEARWFPQWPERWGDWSYGVYLYAFPLQQALAHFGVHKLGLPAYLIASTALAVACGAISWHLVEKPVMRFKR
jgi:peptidoglycan/LPS O-acetylase OafA/YrhL